MTKKISAACFMVVFLVPVASAEQFNAGYAQVDITPEEPVQMWGYFRHARPSEGVKDKLLATAVVLDFGEDKLAIVALDLGRAPTRPMMEVIRKEATEKLGIKWLMINGSHTHHGPIIEMRNEVNKGKGKYPESVAYAESLPGKILSCMEQALENALPAKMGWASADIDLNMNRQTRKEIKPRDTELAVIKFDTLDGEPIAILVNYAAHPSIESEYDMRFSADWPGHMRRTILKATGIKSVYMPGAAGDMDPKPDATGKKPKPEAMGKAVAEEVEKILPAIQTKVPDTPGIIVKEDTFHFESRLDFNKAIIKGLYQQLFFPEVANALLDEFPDSTLQPLSTTAILNNELAIVTNSGELFCEHANRLKRDSAASETFFFGYINGYHMYFPTREAAEEGGYGADPSVAFAEVGAGEKMIDTALENINRMLGGTSAE